MAVLGYTVMPEGEGPCSQVLTPASAMPGLSRPFPFQKDAQFSPGTGAQHPPAWRTGWVAGVTERLTVLASLIPFVSDSGLPRWPPPSRGFSGPPRTFPAPRPGFSPLCSPVRCHPHFFPLSGELQNSLPLYGHLPAVLLRHHF